MILNLLLKIKEIFVIILIAFGIAFGIYRAGQNNQKNKDNEDIINKVKKDEEFKQNLDSISVADKRKWLRERFPNKKN